MLRGQAVVLDELERLGADRRRRDRPAAGPGARGHRPGPRTGPWSRPGSGQACAVCGVSSARTLRSRPDGDPARPERRQAAQPRERPLADRRRTGRSRPGEGGRSACAGGSALVEHRGPAEEELERAVIRCGWESCRPAAIEHAQHLGVARTRGAEDAASSAAAASSRPSRSRMAATDLRLRRAAPGFRPIAASSARAGFAGFEQSLADAFDTSRDRLRRRSEASSLPTTAARGLAHRRHPGRRAHRAAAPGSSRPSVARRAA